SSPPASPGIDRFLWGGGYSVIRTPGQRLRISGSGQGRPSPGGMQSMVWGQVKSGGRGTTTGAPRVTPGGALHEAKSPPTAARGAIESFLDIRASFGLGL